ncbi:MULTISPECIES: hypothetical protein [unclassified Nocardia]|uniref:hypothetical protein n=1 Tax=unclassified Nocardia TaxID=2637762 RepID=UPI00278C5FF7|nr:MULTISPECIES: hypothetical protein [unclassified Nocardia]
MARKYAPLKLSINDDPDLDALTADAQWLYFRVMLTHPTMSACGVMDWRPRKLLRKAKDMTLERILAAAADLERHRFALFDLETEEALARTYVRHDESMRNPKAAIAVIRAYQDVASPELRAMVVTGIAREHAEHPDWSSWTHTISAEGLSRILRRPNAETVGYAYAYAEPIGYADAVAKTVADAVANANPAPEPNADAGPVANGDAASVPNDDAGSVDNTNSADEIGDSPDEDYQSDYQSDSVHFLPATRPPSTYDPSPGGLRNGGTSLRASAPASNEPPSPHCDRHPLGTQAPCGACRDARLRWEAWSAAQPDPAAERRRQRRAALDACRECDAQGWRNEPPELVGHDLPAIRCDHTPMTLEQWLARIPDDEPRPTEEPDHA